MSTGAAEPLRIYVAALGGEGGGILTSWIVALAAAEGWPVQSTSIPGVAQRTGATTYYVEMLPRRLAPSEPRPVFALTPTPGYVDVVIATELLEAGRAIENGYVSPERTTVVASRHRTYTIHEKSAMTDERYPGERVLKAIETLAARAVVLDLAEIARRSGAVINSVVLGALAATEVLPLPAERFEPSLRASGVAVEDNLRGFRAGLDAARGRADEGAAEASAPPARAGADAAARFPAEAQTFVALGVERLTDYQDAAYAGRYVALLKRVLAADRAAGGERRGWTLTREAARYLALWMSYEDIIRVAALKTSRARWRQIAAANPLHDGDTLRVTEFLKPGIEEAASLLPPRMGRAVHDWARHSGREDALNVGMRLRTTSLTGFLAMRALARLKPWRPRSYRFGIEIPAAEAWIGRAVAAAAIDYDFAVEVVECARVRKGYGATHRRGSANFSAIMSVVDAALAERRSAADTVAELRGLALSDPEGRSTLDAVAALGREPAPTAEGAVR